LKCFRVRLPAHADLWRPLLLACKSPRLKESVRRTDSHLTLNPDLFCYLLANIPPVLVLVRILLDREEQLV
jgi:hypothetical protein